MTIYIILIVIDYITRLLNNLYYGNTISSDIAYKGLMPKLQYILIICALMYLEKYHFIEKPFLDLIINYLISMEILSIIENLINKDIKFNLKNKFRGLYGNKDS